MTVEITGARTAYDALAPFYDEFTRGYAHEAWIEAIEARATALGLRGHRALDLACGTGKSTGPLLARGYSVLACDISPAMVDQARRNFPGHEDAFFVADIRALPQLGRFDLILCLNDSLNYLVDSDQLRAVFRGVARLLSRDGVFVFDLNSLLTYRTAFAHTFARDGEHLFFAWVGEHGGELGPGEFAAATVEVFSERADGLWERHSSRHLQRHHPPAEVRAALTAGGLRCVRVDGQLPGARLEAAVDETRHIKLVYFARRDERQPHTTPRR